MSENVFKYNGGKKMNVLLYPNQTLTNFCNKITVFNGELKETISNMLFTMYDAGGVGLAANQVGLSIRMFVADCSDSRDQPEVFINPVIIYKKKEEEMKEGCLSFPNEKRVVPRFSKIKVQYENEDGKKISRSLDGLLAQCFQHELDHLNGIVFINKGKKKEI